MFSATSHPYALQVAALWFSFVPAFTVALLMIGAQFERLRRRPKPAHVLAHRFENGPAVSQERLRAFCRGYHAVDQAGAADLVVR